MSKSNSMYPRTNVIGIKNERYRERPMLGNVFIPAPPYTAPLLTMHILGVCICIYIQRILGQPIRNAAWYGKDNKWGFLYHVHK